MENKPLPSPGGAANDEGATFKILVMVSLCHFLNDTTQTLLVPSYPLIKDAFNLNFTQIGLITLAYQLTASLLQPLIGIFTDKHPMPYSLPIGMLFTLAGLLVLAFGPTYGIIIAGAMLLGIGSSVFHPESSRMARMAAGGRFGLAQSIFQVGGNAGSACGPLLAAAVIVHYGRHSMSWFAILPMAAAVILLFVGTWAKGKIRKNAALPPPSREVRFPRRVVVRTFLVLLALIFSKYFYTASISSYFIFYLTGKFGVTVQDAQLRLFVFLGAMAAGTLAGGPIGDRIGRKYVIWISILGISPFTLALPYLNLFWTTVFVFIIGLVLSSAFAAIVVFAQEMLPGRVGLVAGLFFGLSFGMGGVGAGTFGKLADVYGIEFVYHICSFLPLLGLAAVFLPDIKSESRRKG